MSTVNQVSVRAIISVSRSEILSERMRLLAFRDLMLISDIVRLELSHLVWVLDILVVLLVDALILFTYDLKLDDQLSKSEVEIFNESPFQLTLLEFGNNWRNS